MLRDGTGNPTAAISFGSQDVTAMNTLTIANAIADTATLTLSKGGSKIVLARSSDDALSFIIGSAGAGSAVLSIKNSGGVTAEVQIDSSEYREYTNAVLRTQITSAGVHKLPRATSGNTLIVGSDVAVTAGGHLGMGICFSSTANRGVFFGSGAPSFSTAQGSLYLRTDGSSTSTRAYINTDGAGTWTAITTAA